MYSKIVNPLTGRKVLTSGILGKKILKQYLLILTGGSSGAKRTLKRSKSLPSHLEDWTPEEYAAYENGWQLIRDDTTRKPIRWEKYPIEHGDEWVKEGEGRFWENKLSGEIDFTGSKHTANSDDEFENIKQYSEWELTDEPDGTRLWVHSLPVDYEDMWERDDPSTSPPGAYNNIITGGYGFMDDDGNFKPGPYAPPPLQRSMSI